MFVVGEGSAVVELLTADYQYATVENLSLVSESGRKPDLKAGKEINSHEPQASKQNGNRTATLHCDVLIEETGTCGGRNWKAKVEQVESAALIAVYYAVCFDFVSCLL
jgi:hypothetical protein